MSINNQTTDMVKKPAQVDWHKADIKAAIHKRGLTLKGLAVAHGYRSVDAVAQALHRPYPKVERIIAAALDTVPEAIWPTRYNTKCSAGGTSRHVKPITVA